MKIVIILCTLFALTLKAVHPVPVEIEKLSDKVEIRPNRIGYPSKNQEFKSNRVVGGSNDKRGAHPYQISLQRLPSSGNWYHTCGGSIISSSRILTAAHCIDSGTPSEYRVVVGEYDFSQIEGSEQTIPVSALILHPQWTRPTINYDIAVIRLSKEISYGIYAQSINLVKETPPDGTVSTVTGWGYTNGFTQARPNILQVFITEREGDYWAQQDSPIYDARTQVATYDSDQGICQGDSGGPLIDNKTRQQYGVVSYLMTPCGSTRSDYYARVSYFRSWILAH